MEYGFFLQTAQGISGSPTIGNGGEIWNWLQNLKQEVTQDLLEEGPLCQSISDELLDDRALAANAQDLEWRHRGQLEARLREIVEAQDRLLDGTYGKCVECGDQLPAGRLAADPAASLCLACQEIAETEAEFLAV